MYNQNQVATYIVGACLFIVVVLGVKSLNNSPASNSVSSTGATTVPYTVDDSETDAHVNYDATPTETHTETHADMAKWVVGESMTQTRHWMVQCPHCGQGLQEYPFKVCSKCGKSYSIPAFTCTSCQGTLTRKCHECDGRGYFIAGNFRNRCLICGGSGTRKCTLCKGRRGSPSYEAVE